MSDPSSAQKPLYLTEAQKRNVEMGPGGWVRRGDDPLGETGCDDPNADPEILVAFRGTASIIGWLSQYRWNTPLPVSEASPVALVVDVYFSENVDVTGNPTVTVTNDQVGSGTSATFVLTYSGGTGTEKLTFTSAVPGAGEYADGDTLSIGANALALAGGTIFDAGTSDPATITHGAGEGNTGNPATGGTNDGATIVVVA